MNDIINLKIENFISTLNLDEDIHKLIKKLQELAIIIDKNITEDDDIGLIINEIFKNESIKKLLNKILNYYLVIKDSQKIKLENFLRNETSIQIILSFADVNSIDIYSREFEGEEELSSDQDTLQIYYNEIRKRKILSPQEEAYLFKKLANKDEDAKNILVESNLRLVVFIAKRYIGKGVEFKDLIQEGNLGLIKAIDKFDLTKGFKFSTYATWWIRQAIVRAIMEQKRTIRIPVHMVENINKIARETRKLSTELGRMPNNEELAEELGISLDKLKEIQEASTLEPTSLDLPVNDDGDSFLGDLIESKINIEDEIEKKNRRKDIIRALQESLTDREMEIIICRIYHKMTLETVGKRFNVTRERIRQIEENAYKKLNNNPTIKAYANKSTEADELKTKYSRENGSKTRSKSIKFYFKEMDLKTLFRVISLLDIEDIELIISKYGPKLDGIPKVLSIESEKRINKLINEIIVDIHAQYQLFISGLPYFFKTSTYECHNILAGLPDNIRKLALLQFNYEDLSFNPDTKLSDKEFRYLFRSLLSKRYLIYFDGITENDVENIKIILTPKQLEIVEKLKNNDIKDFDIIERNFVNIELKEIVSLYKRMKKSLISLIQDEPLMGIKRKIETLKEEDILLIYSVYDFNTLRYQEGHELTKDEFRRLWKIFTFSNKIRRKFASSVENEKPSNDKYDLDAIINLPTFTKLLKLFDSKSAVLILMKLLEVDSSEEFGALVKETKFSLNDKQLLLLEEYKTSIDAFLQDYYKYIRKLRDRNAIKVSGEELK